MDATDMVGISLANAKEDDIAVSERTSSPSSGNYRETFLASFDAEEDKRIMRKVDRRFLLLIGLAYMIKNIDYTNAANVKVLQVGQPRNILKELKMTADEYNWVQSIYFVRLYFHHHSCRVQAWSGLMLTEDRR